jgi:putative glutamine amidotransferase
MHDCDRKAVGQMGLIGVTCCLDWLAGDRIHHTRDRYMQAIVANQVGVPVLLPAIGQRMDAEVYLQHIAGLLLTGSPSMVDPTHYDCQMAEGETVAPSCSSPIVEPASRPLDRARDDTTLPLVRAAVAAGVPVLAICRGIQELNVALGGTLHQNLSALQGAITHQGNMKDPDEVRFAPAHSITLAPGGILSQLLQTTEMMVNSQHAQGVDALADGLVVEAIAPDGVIEAVSHQDRNRFVLGVQWHPEWGAGNDCAVGRAIFREFGQAVARYLAQRPKPQPQPS